MITKKFTRKSELLDALHHMKQYDHIMYKLGLIKNKVIKTECDKEEKEDDKKFVLRQEKTRFKKPNNTYNKFMLNIDDVE